MRIIFQFFLLLWKNFTIHRRKLSSTAAECFLPTLFAFAILVLKLLTKNESYGAKTYKTEEVGLPVFPDILGYVPEAPVAKGIAEMVINKHLMRLKTMAMAKQSQLPQQPKKTFNTKGFKDLGDANHYFDKHVLEMNYLLEFKNLGPNATRLPKNLTLVIHPFRKESQVWHTSEVRDRVFRRKPRRDMIDKSFAYIETLAGKSVLAHWVGAAGQNTSDVDFPFYQKRFVVPPFTADGMFKTLRLQLTLFIVLSFMMSVFIISKNVLYEKEQKIKESMRLMGMDLLAYWFSWFVTCLVFTIPAVCFFTLVLCYDVKGDGALFHYSDPSVIFVLLLCYSLCVVSYALVITCIVNKANEGAIVSGVLFLFEYVPFEMIYQRSHTHDRISKMIFCLSFNVAMGLANDNTVRREARMEGVQWSNIDEYMTTLDNFTHLDSIRMLLTIVVIHFLLIWYLDNVFPGEFGVPKPYFFFLTKDYWCGVPSTKAFEENHSTSLPQGKSSVFMEKEPTNLKVGVQMKGLRKVFGNKVSVSNLTLNMYEGQITVLLGHNGAGKTTTMSMLTGFIPPTKGTAYVNGYDIRTNIESVRKSLGLCPQHDILFDVLTVREHLWFFAKLKGYETGNLSEEINHMVREIDLESKARTRVCKISGGQKRSLSVGISLMGGSKVVFLDEPSSGMDPSTRRLTWDLLQKNRNGRTMLLSTHYMDEADTLGNRIAIMVEGKLQCCGTPLFLKKLYGAGYHLCFEKEPKCDLKKLTQIVQSHVTGAQIESAHTFEVSFLLPDTECSKFPDLFRYLNAHKQQLGITGFGTKATTMEEVFLKSEEITDERELSQSSEQRSSTYRQDEDLHIDHFDSLNRDIKPMTGYALAWTQFLALFKKRFLVALRHWPVTCLLYTLPAVIIFLYFLIDASMEPLYDSSMGEVWFRLDIYKQKDPLKVYVGSVGGGEEEGMSDAPRFYRQIVHRQGGEVVNMTTGQATSLDKFLLEVQKREGRVNFDYNSLVGAVFNSSGSVTALYNGQSYHTLFVSINMLLNAVAKSLLDPSYEMVLGLKPLPHEGELELIYQMGQQHRSGFLVGMFVGMGYAMYSASVVHFILWERQTGVKHMHAISGVTMVTYWAPTFVWDAVSFIPPTLLLFLLIHGTGNRAFLDDSNWVLCSLAVMLFVWAILPCMYSFHFVFESAASGLAGVLVCNLFTVLLANIIVFELTMPGSDTKDLGWWVKVASMVLIPTYNLSESFKTIMTNFLSKQLCRGWQSSCEAGISSLCCIHQPDLCHSAISDDECYDWTASNLSMDITQGMGWCLVALTLQGFVLWIVVFAIEFNFFQKLYLEKRTTTNVVGSVEPDRRSLAKEEDDVASERIRVEDQTAGLLNQGYLEDPLLVSKLKKCYGRVKAVDQLCVGVSMGECFGLLGQSGAGKTTVFRMLTGETAVTSGNAFFNGFDVRTSLRAAQSLIGYCPQNDAHIGELTATETLYLYGRLRGIPNKDLEEVVKTLVQIALLGAHAHRRCGNYSGGNKRKLSLAMALIGNPAFLLLDEPSCGMDPKARRQMWDILNKIRLSGRTLLVSSHSMEECDALCTKLGILLNGRLMCLGSPQHLKGKYGQGYTLVIKMGALTDGSIAPTEPVVEFIQDAFPDTVVFDNHQGYAHLQVKDASVELADVFSLMEHCRSELRVEDYSVNETTLEQVFLMFTMIQHLDEEQRAESCWFLRAGFFGDNLCP